MHILNYYVVLSTICMTLQLCYLKMIAAIINHSDLGGMITRRILALCNVNIATTSYRAHKPVPQIKPAHATLKIVSFCELLS